MTLQEEAELKYPSTVHSEQDKATMKMFREIYIAGANSEHVRREKIQFAIKQVTKYVKSEISFSQQIQELEKQLL